MEDPKILLRIEVLSESNWIGPKIFQLKLVSLSSAKQCIDQWHNLLNCHQRNYPEEIEDCERCGGVIGCSSWEGIQIFYQNDVDPFVLPFRDLKLEIIDDPKIVRAFKLVFPMGKSGSYDLISRICLYSLSKYEPPSSPSLMEEVDSGVTDVGQPPVLPQTSWIISPADLNAFHHAGVAAQTQNGIARVEDMINGKIMTEVD